MSDGGDRRTAPATLGPKETNKFVYFLYIIQLTHILLPRENTFETKICKLFGTVFKTKCEVRKPLNIQGYSNSRTFSC